MHVGCQGIGCARPICARSRRSLSSTCPSLTAPALAPSPCSFAGQTRQRGMVRGYTSFMIGISAKTLEGEDETQRDLIRTLRIHARSSWSGLATACKGSSYRIAFKSCQTYLLALGDAPHCWRPAGGRREKTSNCLTRGPRMPFLLVHRSMPTALLLLSPRLASTLTAQGQGQGQGRRQNPAVSPLRRFFLTRTIQTLAGFGFSVECEICVQVHF